MVILRVTSNLGGQKEDKGMMCSITPTPMTWDTPFWIKCPRRSKHH
jgi:hypothetical protein